MTKLKLVKNPNEKETQEVVETIPPKLYTEAQLKDPNLSDETISEILYAGLWANIQHLKHNIKFQNMKEDVWDFIAKDKEFDWNPWMPLFVILIIMTINFLINIFNPFYSLILAAIGLIYIRVAIPFLKNFKEAQRIKFLNEVLAFTPFHRDHFNKEETPTNPE